MNRFLSFAFLFCLLTSRLSAQSFVGALTDRSSVNATMHPPFRIAADGTGCTLNSSGFSGTLDIAGNTYPANGQLSTVIIKRDLNDSILWSKAFTCGGVALIGDIYTDQDDNIYVTGVFGAAQPNVPTTLDCTPYPISSSSGARVFLIKMAPDGTVRWSNSISIAPGTNYPNSDLFRISGNGTDRVVITSPFMSMAPQAVGSSSIDSISCNLFIAMADSAGSWIKANPLSGSGTSHISMSISMNQNGEIYVGGNCNGTISLGTAGSLSTNSTLKDFVCKADASVNWVWGRMPGSASWWRTEVLADNNGAYFLGSYDSNVTFGTTTLNIAGAGSKTYFTRIDGSGNFQWAKAYGESYSQFYAACKNGNYIYVTGHSDNGSNNFNTFDGVSYDYNASLPQWNTISSISYIVKADLNGTPSGAAYFGHDFSTLNTTKLCASAYGTYLTGPVLGIAIFGSHPLSSNPVNACNYVARYSDYANIISGKTYYDFNLNSTQDAGEPFLATTLNMNDGTGNLLPVISNGAYATGVGTGNFTLMTMNQPLYYYSVPTQQTASFTQVANQTDSLNNFAFQPIPGQNDLVIRIQPGRMRPGFSGTGFVTITNVGTVSKVGMSTISLNHPQLVIDSLTPAANNISGNNATINYSLNPTESMSWTIHYHLLTGLTLGSSIAFIAEASDPLDLTPANNTDTTWAIVTGSFDPNNKTAEPSGNIDPNFIASAKNIDYTIQFQNTGTDTAFTVVITDTLSALLDLNSLTVFASSHPAVTNLNGNTLRFTFYHILLPDSNTNEPMSHGFISYRIKPRSTCQPGDQINNTANIYFDFNSPVITNTIHTDVVTPLGITEDHGKQTLILSPNPVDGGILHYHATEVIEAITVIDATGKTVARFDTGHSMEGFVNLDDLPNGNYQFIAYPKNSSVWRGNVIINR